MELKKRGLKKNNEVSNAKATKWLLVVLGSVVYSSQFLIGCPIGRFQKLKFLIEAPCNLRLNLSCYSSKIHYSA